MQIQTGRTSPLHWSADEKYSWLTKMTRTRHFNVMKNKQEHPWKSAFLIMELLLWNTNRFQQSSLIGPRWNVRTYSRKFTLLHLWYFSSVQSCCCSFGEKMVQSLVCVSFLNLSTFKANQFFYDLLQCSKCHCFTDLKVIEKFIFIKKILFFIGVVRLFDH